MDEEYKVVMTVRDGDFDEFMEELGDVDFEELGVKVVRMSDEDFDMMIKLREKNG